MLDVEKPENQSVAVEMFIFRLLQLAYALCSAGEQEMTPCVSFIHFEETIKSSAKYHRLVRINNCENRKVFRRKKKRDAKIRQRVCWPCIWTAKLWISVHSGGRRGLEKGWSGEKSPGTTYFIPYPDRQIKHSFMEIYIGIEDVCGACLFDHSVYCIVLRICWTSGSFSNIFRRSEMATEKNEYEKLGRVANGNMCREQRSRRLVERKSHKMVPSGE